MLVDRMRPSALLIMLQVPDACRLDAYTDFSGSGYRWGKDCLLTSPFIEQLAAPDEPSGCASLALRDAPVSSGVRRLDEGRE